MVQERTLEEILGIVPEVKPIVKKREGVGVKGVSGGKQTHRAPPPTFSPAESGYLFKALTTLISAYRINVKRAKAKGNVSANEADIAICERLVERIREGMQK